MPNRTPPSHITPINCTECDIFLIPFHRYVVQPSLPGRNAVWWDRWSLQVWSRRETGQPLPWCQWLEVLWCWLDTGAFIVSSFDCLWGQGLHSSWCSPGLALGAQTTPTLVRLYWLPGREGKPLYVVLSPPPSPRALTLPSPSQWPSLWTLTYFSIAITITINISRVIVVTINLSIVIVIIL